MDGIILLCPAAAGMLMLLVIFVEHMNALVDDAPVDLERRNGLAMVSAIIRVGEVPAQVRDHLLCDLGPAAIRRGGDPFLIMRWASSPASNNAPADAATTATTCRTGAAGGGGVGGGCRLVDRHSPAAAARDRRSRRDYATFRHRGERSTRTRYFNHHLVATHEPQHPWRIILRERRRTSWLQVLRRYETLQRQRLRRDVVLSSQSTKADDRQPRRRLDAKLYPGVVRSR